MNEIEGQIDDLLVDWEAARLEGREISAAELCANAPELTDRLAEKIAVLKDLSWVTDPDAVVASEVELIADDTALPDTDVTIAEFVETLSSSGVLNESELARMADAVPTNQEQRAIELARSLVEQNLITTYQAKVILERGDSPLLLDRYVILDSIGAGGMGVVFKALQRSLDRVVAVKVLPQHAVDSPEKVERFQREMRAAAKLSHPNVVQAYDAHESNGVYFFAMEYVKGCDLAKLVDEQGPIPVEQAVDIVRQAAAGLANAHANGVIHRDVKPSNILLGEDGTAKVLDLGLARTRDRAQATTMNDLTRDGLAMGTVTYMSPEQAFDAKEADARSDIYSLGCTLYFLMHGKPLFERPNSVQTVVAHRETPAPMLGDESESVSPELENLFQRMVSKDPESRPQSMDEVLSALAGTSTSESSDLDEPLAATTPNASKDEVIAEPVRGEQSIGRSRMLLAAVVFGLALIAGFLLFRRGDSEIRKRIENALDLAPVSFMVQSDEGAFQVERVGDLPPGEVQITGIIVSPTNDADLEVVREFPEIQSLMVFSTDGLGLQRTSNLQALSSLSNLTDLTMDGFELDRSAVATLADCRQLTAIDFTDCDLALGTLTHLSKLPSLRSLILVGVNIGDEEVKAINQLARIESLDLSQTNVTPLGLQELTLPELSELFLAGVELDNNFAFLDSLPNVSRLTLADSKLDDDGAAVLSKASQLTFLDVSRTKLTAKGIGALAEHRKLRELWLDGLSVNDAVDRLSQMSNIRSFEFEGTDLADDGLKTLAGMSRLQSIGLVDTKVTEEGIRFFEKQRPMCDIFVSEDNFHE